MKALCGIFLMLAALSLITSAALAQNRSCESAMNGSQRAQEKSFPIQVFESANGEKMAFRASGDPQQQNLIIFLNGIDKSMTEWDGVRSQMEAEGVGASYIQLDLLGQGDTARMNPAMPDIPYQAQVGLLHDFLTSQNLKNKNVILIGHSYGGGIAARYAHDHPGVVKDAVLVAPFVDNLEAYQPAGVGAFMASTNFFASMFGMKNVYESAVNYGADLGAISSWSMYSYSGRADGKATLENVIAQTHGIRDINMTLSVSQPGNTRISLIIAGLDELIPTKAHMSLWAHVPSANRGFFDRLPYTHEVVIKAPDLVVPKLRQALGI